MHSILALLGIVVLQILDETFHIRWLGKVRVGSEQLTKLRDRYSLLVKLVDLGGNLGWLHLEVLSSISLEPIRLDELKSSERAATVFSTHSSSPSVVWESSV